MSLDLNHSDMYNMHVPKAYERLFIDAIAGRATLFNRRDVVDAAWGWVEPILQRLAKSNEKPLSYPAGSWGPAASTLLLAREDRLWHEDMG
jgi:glucose-6-phosphate 1-dehydrogenase